MPSRASCRASQAATGVLPVPPTVRLPTTTTGTGTRCRAQQAGAIQRRAASRPAMPVDRLRAARAAGCAMPGRTRGAAARVERHRASVVELQPVQHGVLAVARQQLGVRARLDQAARVHDDDAIGFLDRRQPVRDDERRAVLASAASSCSWIWRSSSVSSADVASSRIRIGVLRSNARAIAMRWRCPPDSSVPRSPTTVSSPLRQLLGELDARAPRARPLRSARRSRRVAERDVAADRVVEQHDVLADEAHLRAQVVAARTRARRRRRA